MAGKHECMICGKTFPSITEHMIHAMKKHDMSYRPHSQSRLRSVSCWACAKPVNPGVYDCTCGFRFADGTWDHVTPERWER